MIWQKAFGEMQTKHGHGESSSPVVYGDNLFINSRVDTVTGVDKPGPLRLGNVGNIYASPGAGGGRVYITDIEGHTIVVSHADHPEVLAFNTLDDEFSASAAIVGKELILRGRKHLYCIAEDTFVAIPSGERGMLIP